jgi:hypothetical protein
MTRMLWSGDEFCAISDPLRAVELTGAVPLEGEYRQLRYRRATRDPQQEGQLVDRQATLWSGLFAPGEGYVQRALLALQRRRSPRADGVLPATRC